jgi:D-inositol-3-phosphate glycosyltransferase
MESVIDNPELRADLSARAARRARGFAWEVTAERLAGVYEAALATPRRASINDSDALTGIPTAVIP